MLLLAPEEPFSFDGEAVDGPPRPARVLWPEAGRPASGEPPGHLRAELADAKACVRAGAHSSAVVAVRRLLEGVCADHGVTAVPLSAALRELRRRGLIEGRLLVWAEELRVIGNQAAHIRAGRVRAEDAADAVVLAEALLDYLYVYTPKYRELRNRRAAAGDPVREPSHVRVPDPLAVKLLRRSRITFYRHKYPYDPAQRKSREQIAADLGVPAERLVKAVLAYADGHVVLAVAPVSETVDLQALARTAGAGEARLAPAADLSRLGTGTISPLGLPLRVPAYVATAVTSQPTVYLASGRHGLELELRPDDLVRLLGARTAAIT
ncbi:YbaK/EbsC family protein [Sphaerisporangium rubeum]|uniref:Cys-tRNA(Pro) deacylase n=1 Tax=Sphaerisporangium rubeum TaxID=321317 RepID=A0A7X0IE77_9ACTN|nr:Cys-tRNA(Pro) deacylase [Sphaerisporangium rubeum]